MEIEPSTESETDRDLLRSRLGVAIDGLRAAWSHHRIALLVVGHHAGSSSVEDGAILSSAEPGKVSDEPVRGAVRPGDVVVRLDAGRVAVLCERLDGMDEAVVIAMRIEEAFHVHLRSAGGRPGPTPTIALTLVGADEPDVAALLHDAGRVPLHSAQSMESRWSTFDDVLRDRVRHRRRLEEDLRAASDGTGLVLRYQPEKELRTGRIAAVEALVRWERSGEMVGPDDFIPLAEETGLIVPIGAWVLDEACSQLARWRREGVGLGVSMAVNVSPPQLLHPEFVDRVGASLEANGLGAGDLVLEITENVLLVDLAAAVRCIDRLRSLGVRMAIDDFGTGHASLTYLHRLPIDAVKLDRSFVDGLGVDDRLTAIVTAVIGLIHALGFECIAEGVSRSEQYEMLRTLGCRLAQGSFIGAPASGEELTPQLR